MLYNLAGIVVFNPEDGSLTRTEDGEVVKLTLPASRLLEVLLTAPHGLMEREVLLTEVWDKYGLRGSHNNLNQYISILRRTLSALGCDDVIVTVPKLGFRLNPEVTIAPAEALPHMVSTTETKQTARPTAIRTSVWTSGKLLLLTLGMLLLLIAFTLHKKHEWSEREIRPTSGEPIRQCQLYFLQNLNSRDREMLRRNVVAILNENSVSCESDRLIYLDNYMSKHSTSLGRTLLSSCRLSDTRKVVDCTNFYYLDRSQK